ncbi:CpsD/CapB family tyrosine-protein kinase [Megasphaera vaginalis (ex Bordigoni et al. 2020)]|uniref:CpsD/CapB family tyrosine-protein kinase n=1 Tax=Megasphaera vaginalis (ex Bordigoni et al. 2020) TaxID=2045301 RepID=UPI000C7B37F4|nr:CpsD/CapB family tyrosine-protein kinase [Megasphaera vaginalis (ex Bordigoni et al. 2020)]
MAQVDLIAHYDAKSPVSEAYRAVRTNLQFAGAGKKLKYISFTSATPGEGKSATIANIAITLAQDKKKVLLIDCDMRKPRQHKQFGLPNKGLSNCIAMGEAFEDVVSRDVFEYLDVLPSGPVPPNPSELLGSPAMLDILNKVEDTYDYILLDMPPVLAVTDVAVLGRKVDGIVYVIKSGAVSPDEAKEAKKRLDQSGATILGAVLNCVPQKHHNSYGYYYYDENRK